jgi:hypothetical protein
LHCQIIIWICKDDVKKIRKWFVHECKAWAWNLNLKVILIHLHGWICTWMISYGWMSFFMDEFH